MPPKIRLHHHAALSAGATLDLSPAQSHYLRRVMRLGAGDQIGVFNAQDGEWRAGLETDGRHRARLHLAGQLRSPEPEPDLWLLFAPVKRLRLDMLAQKVTELGAARLQPVRTEFTVVDRVNIHRLQSNAIEAAEQSGRLSLPDVQELIDLDALCGSWPAGRQLYWADESGAGTPAIQAFAAGLDQPSAILIGPEGGLGPGDRSAIGEIAESRAIDLGPRILRAETAAMASLTLWQAVAGDWRPDRHAH